MPENTPTDGVREELIKLLDETINTAWDIGWKMQLEGMAHFYSIHDGKGTNDLVFKPMLEKFSDLIRSRELAAVERFAEKIKNYLNSEWRRFDEVMQQVRKGESHASLDYCDTAQITLDVAEQEVDRLLADIRKGGSDE